MRTLIVRGSVQAGFDAAIHCSLRVAIVGVPVRSVNLTIETLPNSLDYR